MALKKKYCTLTKKLDNEKGATTLSIMTFKITALSIRSFYVTPSVSDIITILCFDPKCHYGESRILSTIVLNAVRVNAVMLSLVAP